MTPLHLHPYSSQIELFKKSTQESTPEVIDEVENPAPNTPMMMCLWIYQRYVQEARSRFGLSVHTRTAKFILVARGEDALFTTAWFKVQTANPSSASQCGS
jgi:hypothetical protein